MNPFRQVLSPCYPELCLDTFRLSSKRPDAQLTRLPFSVQPAAHKPDALPEIPQASDFRTSLILTELVYLI